MKTKSFIKILPFFLLFISYSSCKKADICESVSCLNGGSCVNGFCDCPTGYTGPDCSNYLTPSSIKVTNIKVTRFPATESNGAGWDLTSGPDILVTIHHDNNLVYEHSTFYQNADASLSYDFEPDVNFSFSNPTDKYTISVYDYDDFDLNDFMGGIEFSPYVPNTAFSTKFNLDAGGSVAFELLVEYFF
ncbi:MAG: calcium-binding EGF-like domain-containing protein [Saprospiraceae bacterium]|nr:calcium-binding EGF-like domain-containing protein [Saprospiraceae bacterium]